MEGDTDTAQAIQTLFLELDLDWEEAFSCITNDSIAHTAFQIIKKARKRQQEFFDSLTHSTRDYLQEEGRLIPHSIELENFIRSVDTLRSDVDRCEARINRLLQNPTLSTNAFEAPEENKGRNI